MGAEVRRASLGLTIALHLLILVGESAWVYPWSLAAVFWFADKGQPLLSVPAVAAVLAVAMIAARLAARVPRIADGFQDVRLQRVRGFLRAFVTSGRLRRALLPYLAQGVVVLVGVAVACLVALEEIPAFQSGPDWPEVGNQLARSSYGGRATLAWFLAALLWWRGVRLGRPGAAQSKAEDELTTGVTAMAVLLVLMAVSGQGAPVAGPPLMLSTLTFVFTVLAGAPLAHVLDVAERQRRRGAPVPQSGGCWLTILVAVAGGLMLVTLALAQVVNFERILALWEALRGPVGDVLWSILYLLALPFELLFRGLAFLIGLLPKYPRPPRPRLPGPTDWMDQWRQQVEPLTLAPELLFALKVVAILALAGVLIWFLIRAVSRLGALWRWDGVEEIRDSVWSWPTPAAVWRWLLSLLVPVRARAARLLAGRGSPVEPPLGESVRDLYRSFLALGASLGHPRPSHETPLEYEHRLREGTLPPDAGELRSITEAYHQVRYAGPVSPAPDQDAIAAALRRLRSLWRR